MKKILTILAATMLAGGLCAYAEKEERKKGGPPEGRPSREELLKKFDKDGDGKLNEDERAEMRGQALLAVAELAGGERALPVIERGLARSVAATLLCRRQCLFCGTGRAAGRPVV